MTAATTATAAAKATIPAIIKQKSSAPLVLSGADFTY